MKDAIPMHVVKCFEHGICVLSHFSLREVVATPFDRFIQVHFHEFKNQSKTTCGFIIKHVMQFDDIRVPSKPSQGLNLTKVVNLLYTIESVLHALDRHSLAILD